MSKHCERIGTASTTLNDCEEAGEKEETVTDLVEHDEGYLADSESSKAQRRTKRLKTIASTRCGPRSVVEDSDEGFKIIHLCLAPTAGEQLNPIRMSYGVPSPAQLDIMRILAKYAAGPSARHMGRTPGAS